MSADDEREDFSLDEAVARHYARQQADLPPMPPDPGHEARAAHYSASLAWVRENHRRVLAGLPTVAPPTPVALPDPPPEE